MKKQIGFLGFKIKKKNRNGTNCKNHIFNTFATFPRIHKISNGMTGHFQSNLKITQKNYKTETFLYGQDFLKITL